MSNISKPSDKFYEPSNEKWVVILNQEEFEKRRKGTQVDVANLTSTLKRVKCNYVVFDDLNKDEILNKIPLYVESNLEQLKEMEGLMFFVLTHGGVTDELFAKDSGYNLYDFVNKFNAENLPMMANKPKLFFISACRGGVFQTTHPINWGNIQTDAAKIKDPIKWRQMYTNLLIAFGTNVNTLGLRNEVLGTHFIETLCSTFDTFIRTSTSNEADIIKILVRTNKQLIGKSGPGTVLQSETKQLGQVYSSLMAPFIFRKR